LPTTFRDTLLHFSRRVMFYWCGDPYDCKITAPPEPVSAVVTGTCYWDLAKLEHLDETRSLWAKSFSNPSDPFDAVWQRKLVAIQQDGYGNLLALDISQSPEGPVVYLAHEPDPAHGYRLGSDFFDFMDRWSQVGCAGPHSWGWLPFTTGPLSLIDPNSQNARIWREWLGLKTVKDDPDSD
jgi:hypothetical protein